MIDKRKLSHELTEAFIGYQHRLDCPFPSATDSHAVIVARYNGDPIFRAKVDSLVAGVMDIVSRHIDAGEDRP